MTRRSSRLAAHGVLTLILATACTSPLMPSGSRPSGTVGSSGQHEETTEPTERAFEPWFGEVAVESLEVYGHPEPGADALARIPEGQLVQVINELPTGWARLEFMYLHPTSTEWIFGWARLGTNIESISRADLGPCGSADVATLAAMAPGERHQCFGSEVISLRGWATLDGADAKLFTGRPGWLATPSSFLLMAIDPEVGGPAVPVHLSPAVSAEWPIGDRVVVEVTLNHDASSGCRRSGPSGIDAESEAESTLWCQQQLVVEELRTVEE